MINTFWQDVNDCNVNENSLCFSLSFLILVPLAITQFVCFLLPPSVFVKTHTFLRRLKVKDRRLLPQTQLMTTNLCHTMKIAISLVFYCYLHAGHLSAPKNTGRPDLSGHAMVPLLFHVSVSCSVANVTSYHSLTVLSVQRSILYM